MYNKYKTPKYQDYTVGNPINDKELQINTNNPFWSIPEQNKYYTGNPYLAINKAQEINNTPNDYANALATGIQENIKKIDAFDWKNPQYVVTENKDFKDLYTPNPPFENRIPLAGMFDSNLDYFTRAGIAASTFLRNNREDLTGGQRFGVGLATAGNIAGGLLRNIEQALTGAGFAKSNTLTNEEYELERERDRYLRGVESNIGEKDAFTQFYNRSFTKPMGQDGGFLDKNPYIMQDGGMNVEATEQVLSGDITPQPNNPMVNVELEKGEYVIDPTTMSVQYVDGLSHQQSKETPDGIEYSGTPTQLPEGAMVISNNGIAPKELMKLLGVNVKGKKPTYANIIDALEETKEINKLNERQAELTKKAEKYLEQTDDTKKQETYSRNLEYLSNKIKEVEEEKTPLLQEQFRKAAVVFQYQEMEKQKGTYKGIRPPIEQPMQDGGEINEQLQEIAQGVYNEIQNGADPNQLAQELINEGLSEEEVEQIFQMIQSSYMQEGGDMQGGSIIEQVGQMIEQGVSPEEIVLQMIQNNIDPNEIVQIFIQLGANQDEATELVQQALSSAQGGQQDMYEQNPYAQEQMMDDGRYYYQKTPKGTYNVYERLPNTSERKYIGFSNKDGGDVVRAMDGGKNKAIGEKIKKLIDEGYPQKQAIAIAYSMLEKAQDNTYSFSTRIGKIGETDVEGLSPTELELLNEVEKIQKYRENVGYGQKMVDVENTIKTHDWYFDTEEKKQEFREQSKKKGKQPAILAFQKAYNDEIRKRATDAGLKNEEVNNIIEEYGFSGKGVRKIDGLFGAYTSTRPIFNFTKKEEGETKIEEQNTEKEEEKNEDKPKPFTPYEPSKTESYSSYFPKTPIQTDYIAPFRMTALNTLPNQEISPVVRSIEPILRANRESTNILENMGSQVVGGLDYSGIAGKLATNVADEIAKVEAQNQQNVYQADTTNLQLRRQTDLANIQQFDKYNREALGGEANTIKDYNAAMDNIRKQVERNIVDQRTMAALNASNPNMQFGYNPYTGQYDVSFRDTGRATEYTPELLQAISLLNPSTKSKDNETAQDGVVVGRDGGCVKKKYSFKKKK